MVSQTKLCLIIQTRLFNIHGGIIVVGGSISCIVVYGQLDNKVGLSKQPHSKDVTHNVRYSS